MNLTQPIKNIVRKIRAYFTFKRAFYAGLIFKGIDGAIELLAAITLLFINPNQIHELAVQVTRSELLQDPHDFIANFVLNSTSHISHSVITFFTIYLFIHAGVKLISVFGIILKQLWAYPFALITLSLLALYQLYTIITKPSVGIVVLTVIDIIVIWLIAREYKRIREGKDLNMITS